MSADSKKFKLVRVPSLRTVDRFREHVIDLGVRIPCADRIETGDASPLVQPVNGVEINGKTIGNRWAVHPMEGWDGTTTGRPTKEVFRRWRRFGLSGAKLICGGEAMAVCPDGRANPNQLIIRPSNQAPLEELRKALVKAHVECYGSADDLVIGFQLTHSGRFCRPHDKSRWEPRVAYRHPILDRRFHVESDEQVFSDSEVEGSIESYIEAAQVAANAGADFVDIKHCHGYLLHEFLSAFTRPGKYGGSFENRTRILREIVQGIRDSGNEIDIGVRLSAFDFVPFRPDPERSVSGKLGIGIPERFQDCLPYRYAFSTQQENPIAYELNETHGFVRLCHELGVKILNVSAGSPYYNPHIQRPASYPPSDGYQPVCDPLVDVARQIDVVRQIKEKAPDGIVVVGSGYSYLQDFLPQVAQRVVREGWVDIVGLGRMVLSYPEILADATTKGELNPKLICRTFSDCTTAPRNGLVSGCYPLDKFYGERPEFQQLKQIKKSL
ncbi:MAG: NADPH dehydrogenase [Verrucomicrobia subdivision 3 bacterium]|nr:NADPH dehydrogenase [Limisphaerales bacterium]MCS1413102.1 NADPH dehydrogenase [Limisphaerales bacterium]